jgi:uncharacterized damage-inducible protein DinB
MTRLETIQQLWQWMIAADREVLAASNAVDDPGFIWDQGISFGSLHKLLAHAMIAQRTWLSRLKGNDIPYPRGEPIPDRAALPGAWGKVQTELMEFANSRTEASLDANIRSTNPMGTFEAPTWATMLHVADHATYHRGQINTMIKHAGGKPPGSMFFAYAIGAGIGKKVEGAK